MERGYSLREVADALGLKVRTIRQWVHDGKLQAVKPKGAKQWVVFESELRRVQGADES
jgi:excisionase family DNA binding protein